MGGDDLYSASKAACEIWTASYRASFADLPPIATGRAGNVIGGDDFGRDRLIPDLVRAKAADQPLALRNPNATRPFQHVLDVVAGYLILAEALAKGDAPQAVNFDPAEAELSVRDLFVGPLVASYGRGAELGAVRRPADAQKPRLALDSGLARARLNWAPRHSTAKAIAATAKWYSTWSIGHDMTAASDAAIRGFLEI